MLESQYQALLIKKLEAMFEGCLILKNDSAYRQGIPDLLILHRNRWALLEVKASATSEQQPNQAFYVAMANKLSFASFIYPENETEVLNALQHTLQPPRKTRVPKSE